MVVSKAEILDEIRRCAADNDGKPLGRERFTAETGIKPNYWNGVYWATWSDAISEAGLQPNSMQRQKHADDELLRHLALITRKLARFPTEAQLKLERRSDGSIPNANSIRVRLGIRSEQVARLRVFAAADETFADVYEILSVEPGDQKTEAQTNDVSAQPTGVVYLIKSGRYYKIGRSNNLGRRSYEIALQLPEKAKLVHSFETDDPPGIERYWHDRFADRRQNGEWFNLSQTDVAAFKRRRRFM